MRFFPVLHYKKYISYIKMEAVNGQKFNGRRSQDLLTV